MVRAVSTQKFQVETQTGDSYFGSLREPEKDNQIHVGFGDFQIDLDHSEVVKITPIAETFWAQLDGSLSLGFSFTKASDVAQMTFTGSVSRRKRKYLTKLSANSIITSQETEATTQNSDATLRHDLFFGRKWLAGGGVSAQRNDEQGVDFRLLLTGTGGKNFVQSNSQLLVLQGGLAFNQEDVSDGDNQQSLELVGTFDWAVFKYKRPETDLRLDLSVFRSVTETGRTRAIFNTTLRRELIKDFFWDLQLYLNYDSKPPTAGASTTDYGIVTGLGWSF